MKIFEILKIRFFKLETFAFLLNYLKFYINILILIKFLILKRKFKKFNLK